MCMMVQSSATFAASGVDYLKGTSIIIQPLKPPRSYAMSVSLGRVATSRACAAKV